MSWDLWGFMSVVCDVALFSGEGGRREVGPGVVVMYGKRAGGSGGGGKVLC